MNPVHLLIGLGVMFAVAFVVGFVKQPPDQLALLRERYIVLSRQSRAQALHDLEERIDKLRVRFPGKSYRWYLDWLVTDLERAKR